LISIKKELCIFVVLFMVTSLAVHYSEWFTNPLVHIDNLFSHPMPLHPFLYVFLVYIVVAVLRGVFILLKKLFRK